MIEIAQVQNLLWGANAVVDAVLAALLLLRKNYRRYPSFFFYILLVDVQNILFFVTYRQWGFNSLIAWRIAWMTLGVLICARALAVAEVCKHLLARYRGVWALAWRLLLACAVLVLICSLIIGKHQWKLAVHSASRGLDLAIAASIVGLFLFIKFYDVKTDSTDRILAVGFFLYSCFGVLNNTFLEHWLDRYSNLWNLLGMLAFLFSLSLWTWGLRLPRAVPSREKVFMPGNVYSTIGSEVNLRLQLLNESLNRFWNAGAPQP
jgi:hypothetical protein